MRAHLAIKTLAKRIWMENGDASRLYQLEIERISVYAQRLFWNALVLYKQQLRQSSPILRAIEKLAEAYVEIPSKAHGNVDNVCEWLAYTMLPGLQIQDRKEFETEMSRYVGVFSERTNAAIKREEGFKGTVDMQRKRQKVETDEQLKPTVTLSEDVLKAALVLEKKAPKISDPGWCKSVLALLESTINPAKSTHDESAILLSQLSNRLQLSSRSDDVIYTILNAMIEQRWNSRYVGIILAEIVVPKLEMATTLISHSLYQALLAVSNAFVDKTVLFLIVPLMHTKRKFGSSQGEIILRVIRRGIPDSKLDELMSALLTADENQLPVMENEHKVAVIQHILDRALGLKTTTLSNIVSQFDKVTKLFPRMCTSMRFNSLIFRFIKVYPAEVCDQMILD